MAGLRKEHSMVQRKDIAEQVSKIVGFTVNDTDMVFVEALEVITSHLKAGRAVAIRGLGTFKTSDRKARKAQNPKTGEAVYVPARKVPCLKWSWQVRNQI